MNQEQVRNLFRYIDSVRNEAVKEDIFTQLGFECFHSRNLSRWLDGFNGDLRQLMDYVNVRRESKYWESLVLSPDGRQLTLTGKAVEGCACSFADCANPPLSLCRYCCRKFQQEFFMYLLKKPVTVIITEAFLLGDKRCSTVIEIGGSGYKFSLPI